MGAAAAAERPSATRMVSAVMRYRGAGPTKRPGEDPVKGFLNSRAGVTVKWAGPGMGPAWWRALFYCLRSLCLIGLPVVSLMGSGAPICGTDRSLTYSGAFLGTGPAPMVGVPVGISRALRSRPIGWPCVGGVYALHLPGRFSCSSSRKTIDKSHHRTPKTDLSPKRRTLLRR